MALGRTFRIKERASLNVRAEFTNLFNRAGIPNPTNGQGLGQTSASTQLRSPSGAAIGGFGWINTNPATPVRSPGKVSSSHVSSSNMRPNHIFGPRRSNHRQGPFPFPRLV
jgi:hypothetical protein